MAEKLKPCPFCGGTAELFDVGNWHTKSRSTDVQCGGCKVKKRFSAIRQGHEATRQWATTWWNTRADHIPALLEALTRALPYVETAEADEAYKPGEVAKVTAMIRTAIRQAEGGE